MQTLYDVYSFSLPAAAEESEWHSGSEKFMPEGVFKFKELWGQINSSSNEDIKIIRCSPYGNGTKQVTAVVTQK